MRAFRGRSGVTRRAALGGLALGLAGACGCNARKDGIRPDNLLGGFGSNRGEMIEPKRVTLRMAILSRPFRDPTINDTVWRSVDEQAVAPAERQALQANGVRIGRITGDLPRELEALLNAPPPNKVEPVTFLVPESTQELFTLAEPLDQVSLLLNLAGRVTGKDYSQASGFYRVTPEHHDAGSVALRLTPEVHHGQVQTSYQPLQPGPGYSPQEFKIANGQQQDALSDLTANLVVEPNQTVVLGCHPDQERSLGAFLFTASGDQPDQRTQRMVLIWADRNQMGVIDERGRKTAPLEPVAEAAPTPARDESPR
ncbi:hypothetical protein [Paludisphaera rhizosphaerae]|uniref:hypothetical protein n=1 Tax=Paludisphaera rhizosphaerae TaxID=2711216 RepID=UPI0013EDDC38|nr:hypothetical protein [Paludisphaera rhizosphaerae]